MQGRIFEIQHFSVHDGPGIRSTVFLKGCQLRCKWCHNPESIPTRVSEISYLPNRCIGCRRCVAACGNGAHSFRDGIHVFDREKCTFCSACAEACPTRSLTKLGYLTLPETVVEEVLRDRSYYGDDGGMTLSGGEAMLQPEFSAALLRLAREAGINTALETNLSYDYTLLDTVKCNTDLFLIDWKESNPEKHREYTGVSNERIRENLARLHGEGCRILLRCPIIPGYNDREDHLKTIADLTREMPDLVGAELLPYHNLGSAKNSRFGLEGLFTTVSLINPTESETRAWVACARGFGGRIINED